LFLDGNNITPFRGASIFGQDLLLRMKESSTL